MVNIEELSEEDQRKYTELQEYIKQQFLSGAKILSCRRSS
jgi:predicted peroxiredoxin